LLVQTGIALRNGIQSAKDIVPHRKSAFPENAKPRTLLRHGALIISPWYHPYKKGLDFLLTH